MLRVAVSDVVGVQGSVDCGEGATNVPNRLVCCRVSVAHRLCLFAQELSTHESYFASAMSAVLCSCAN